VRADAGADVTDAIARDREESTVRRAHPGFAQLNHAAPTGCLIDASSSRWRRCHSASADTGMASGWGTACGRVSSSLWTVGLV